MTAVQTELWLPKPPILILPPALITSGFGPMVATGDKLAFIGRVKIPDRSTSKDITKVGIRFGAVTKAGGSGLTLSLQDVDLTNGPVMRPDGTQDQTFAIANGNASFVSNANLHSGALSANRTVAHGQLLAVVVEYDGSGRLGADSVALSAIQSAVASYPLAAGAVSGLTGGTVWAAVANGGLNNVVLEFTDGSFGTLDQGFPISAASSDAFNSGSNPEIIGLEFQVPMDCKCDGFWMTMQAAASADFQVILYDGNTPMVTNSYDSNAWRANATAYYHEDTLAEQTLSKNHTYRLGLKPTTANSVTLYNYSVSAAGHLQAHAGGTAFQYNTFHTSAWGSPTATKRPFMGVRFSAVDDGSGSGAAGAVGVIGS